MCVTLQQAIVTGLLVAQSLVIVVLWLRSEK